MTWQDVFENEKAHAREEVARLFEPLAREMLEGLQDIQEQLVRVRRQMEG